jgi:hypothetical protein
MEEMVALFGDAGGSIEKITRDFVVSWLKRLHWEVEQRAEAEGLMRRDYACTLLAAVVGQDCAVFLQIGDGAIIVACEDDPDSFAWIFWPQRGEYENATAFATDSDVASHLSYEWRYGHIHELALFTDGLQRLVLDLREHTVYSPFFRQVFPSVRSEEEGHSTNVSGLLRTFLSSERINDRTDDDKTLLLATRRAVTTPTPASGDACETL